MPTITIDDRLWPDKISRYTPDLLPGEISVTYENSVSTLTTTSDYPQPLFLTSDDPNPLHSITKESTYHGVLLQEMWWKRCYKKRGFIAPYTLIKTRNFITVLGSSLTIQIWVLPLWNINIVWPFVQLADLFASLLSLTFQVELFFVLVFFLFHWSHPVQIPMSDIVELSACIVPIKF